MTWQFVVLMLGLLTAATVCFCVAADKADKQAHRDSRLESERIEVEMVKARNAHLNRA